MQRGLFEKQRKRMWREKYVDREKWGGVAVLQASPFIQVATMKNICSPCDDVKCYQK